ncbi:androgen-induced gene 1 protein [Octopus bimaculoides]|uniref:Androgen-induced gene 1 protein n=1 Tax=Octopus bimaculoides TaxID=37653 RepID=A0A0L8IB25_OCTBM|nr:androgen-induced gene 1 protein [Octopus bimaculoides]|eukprot:XP_014780321.1 PREDICTED: androgen-induced gene 1 protein-like [Octopus bimaculoides]
MAKVLVTLFHLLCFLITGFGLYYDTFVVTYGWSVYAGKLRYATYWDIVLQTVYFGLALVSDIYNSKDFDKNNAFSNEFYSKTKLIRLVRYISCGMAFPLGNFVCLSFWIIYFFHRELIYPSYLDDIIPWWLNHILHSVPIVLQWLDKFFYYQTYPKNGVLGILALTGCYQVWMVWIAHRTRTWIYPFLDYLPIWYRILFLACMWGCLAGFYFVGEFLHYIFWTRKSRKNVKLY